MNDFNQIQELWNSQSKKKTSIHPHDIIQKTEIQIQKIKNKYIGTAIILAITLAVLIAYFFWIGFYQLSLFTTGMSLMIGMLSWRITLELISMKRFSKIKPNASFVEYSERITAYHIWRKKVHLLHTPIIYLSYIAGFVLLLPVFKSNMSAGMFWYCAISGSVFLIGFGFLLISLIQKEIKMLNYLKEITNFKD
ncbi:hypothetical protein [Flavobacterium cerinum]|uniref:Uncharacterized protein n=1 Tax=Flavobacterium cerinum TaxID=2502784 RepID=A0A3S3U2Z9_9FLAO|nr:hypothetical protein [Flavobacterium cerinum]RWX00481.1 hypothetical protein EPI11_09405 [Flavobacterium cerinum]